MIRDVGDDSFEAEVLSEKNRLVMINFYAPSSPKCQEFAATLAAFDQKRAGQVKIVRVNVETNPLLTEAFDIQKVPSVVTFYDDQPIAGVVGAVSVEILEQLLAMSLQQVRTNNINNMRKPPPAPPAA